MPRLAAFRPHGETIFVRRLPTTPANLIPLRIFHPEGDGTPDIFKVGTTTLTARA